MSSTTGHENEAINVQGLKASLHKLKTENLDPNVNKGVVNEATCSTAAGTAAKTVTAPASFSLTSGAAILVKFTNGISVDNATLAVGSTAAKPIYYKGAALEADYVEAGDIIMLKYDGTNYNVVGKLGGRALPEVQIGGSTPTSESEIKLFVDENSDDTVEVYTKAQANILYAGKTDKVSGATNGNFAGLDTNGNLVDSGKNANSFQLKVTDCAMLGGGYVTCSTAGGTAAKTVTISNFLLLPNCRISVLFTNAFTATNPTLSINGGTAIAIMHFGRAMEVGKVHANTILTMVYDGTYWQVIGIESMAGSAPSGAVDLALPSGLLWCEHNVGAATPYEDGLYFSWGNITGHTGTDGYDFGTNNNGPYASTPGAALTGSISTNNTYDAARHNMGAPWRMPTVGEFQELKTQCDSEWTDEDGIAGRRFTSRINGNSIFFPASGYRSGTGLSQRGMVGYYWNASLYSQTYVFSLNFNSGNVDPAFTNDRFKGCPVRAVQ